MNSARAEELPLILPFLSRLATVDLFGPDDLRDRVEVLLGFDMYWAIPSIMYVA
jgi:hypothetical protein